MMITRLGLRTTRASRNFQTSARAMNKVFGEPATGLYSNLPFKVKNTKIPFALKWWGTFGFFFSFPFITAYVHMKRAGNL
ncbi:hypothetical protein RJF_0599 [Candidozyma auris]|uniref:Cytochrome c oxidase subunit 8, mitochondrial n=2 Tax=Candidozyma auris TaxID=498019 RepID=A0A2H0ZLT7_CANAR|nr:hypothetical protein B9J08_003183 [[Candida] auris]PSK78838.1 hypothetical protein CJJ07_001276 [[Candida] auris]